MTDTDPRALVRYSESENRNGLGFSNGLVADESGSYVSYRDYTAALDRAERAENEQAIDTSLIGALECKIKRLTAERDQADAAGYARGLREAAIELEVNWPHKATPEMRDAILALLPADAPAPGDPCPGYAPDIQAQGDCRNCGLDRESHEPAPDTEAALKDARAHRNATIKIRQTHGGAYRGTCDEWGGVLSACSTPGEAYDEAYRQLLNYRALTLIEKEST